LTVEDPRVIQTGRRALTRRLMERLAGRSEVCSARIDLAVGSCRVKFVPEASDSAEMARVFSLCVHDALEGELSGLGLHREAEPSWTSLLSERTGAAPVVLAAMDDRPGRLRVRLFSAPRRRRWADLLDEIGALGGVRSLQVRRGPDGLDIDYDPTRLSRDEILASAARAWSGRAVGGAGRAARPFGLPISRSGSFLVRGPRRLLYLALGGGCLVLTLVGLVVPGIPTVPFLLATSYYFARSSPALHRALLETQFFGPVLAEWETHNALSRQSKLKLATFTVVIVVITLLLAPGNPVLLLVLALITSLSLYGIGRIPEVEMAPSPRALPAP
jgi:uncharacterized membrane protein YbaN (DUF454 family)